jgi:hypothetical protein
MSRGQRDGSLLPYSRLSGPPFQTHFSEKLVVPGIEPGLWTCSQELCPLDHREFILREPLKETNHPTLQQWLTNISILTAFHGAR